MLWYTLRSYTWPLTSALTKGPLSPLFIVPLEKKEKDCLLCANQYFKTSIPLTTLHYYVHQHNLLHQTKNLAALCIYPLLTHTSHMHSYSPDIRSLSVA